jgi:hypothetical protein
MRGGGAAGDGAARSSDAARRPFAWGQFAGITAAALGVFLLLRLLPIGTNLSHMDFRVDPKATGAIEFCDPLNPQFIPVVAARSPVTMTVAAEEPVVAGRAVRLVFTLRTGSGKPIAPEDLLVTHTRRLHLLAVDATLGDYQHLHPEPTRRPGEWAVEVTLRRSGVYRIFGDFTPAATGRGLYASVDLPVAPPADAAPAGAEPASPGRPGRVVIREGHRFELEVVAPPARAARPFDLRFSIQRTEGGPVALEPVMGALAHLVAFDAERSGFAHLHPVEDASGRPAAANAPVLHFKLTIPRPGWYTIWAQINLRGREEFVPFGIEVVE